MTPSSGPNCVCAFLASFEQNVIYQQLAARPTAHLLRRANVSVSKTWRLSVMLGHPAALKTNELQTSWLPFNKSCPINNLQPTTQHQIGFVGRPILAAAAFLGGQSRLTAAKAMPTQTDHYRMPGACNRRVVAIIHQMVHSFILV
jgi:hypothetical protein